MSKVTPAIMVLLCACATANVQSDYDYSKEPDPRRSEYVVGVADSLSIRVWKNPDLSTDGTVRPDGTITVPLIGDLQASGRTPSELREEVKSQLTKYVRDEGIVVTVAVTSVNSYTFTVSGNVQQPGVFSAKRYVTVVDAVQLAGGPNRFASPRQTRILRRDGKGNVREIPIDYLAVVEGKRPEANLALMPGDQVHMP